MARRRLLPPIDHPHIKAPRWPETLLFSALAIGIAIIVALIMSVIDRLP